MSIVAPEVPEVADVADVAPEVADVAPDVAPDVAEVPVAEAPKKGKKKGKKEKAVLSDSSSDVSHFSKELICPERLRKVIANLDAILPPKFQTYWCFDREINQSEVILDMMRHLKNGSLCVKYLYSKRSKGHGRQYAFRGRSLQSLSRVIRHTLSKDVYRDFDIKNCHPTIALHYCKAKGWDVPYLEKYVTQRDRVIQKVITVNQEKGLVYTYEAVKKIFLSVLNGGTKDYEELPVKTECLVKMVSEVADVFGKMLETDEGKALLEEVTAYNATLTGRQKKDEAGVKRSVCNKIFIDIENDILEKCVTWCEENGLSVENIVLMFDGFMLPKTVAMPDDWAERLSDYVAEHTYSKIRVQFVEKEMDEGVDLSSFPDVPVSREVVDVPETMILECISADGAHDAVANVLVHAIGAKYVDDGTTHYGFKNHRWCPFGKPYFYQEVASVARAIFEPWMQYYQHEQESLMLKARFMKGEGEDVNHVELAADKMEDRWKKLSVIMLRCMNAGYMDSLYKLFRVKTMDQSVREKFDCTPGLIGFENGVLDVRGEVPIFRDGKPEDYITLSTRYDYVAQPVKENRFAKFVREIVDPDTYEPLMTFLGNLWMGGNKNQTATFFVGNGSNGKSLLCNVIEKAFGDYSKGVGKELYTKEKKQSGGPEPHLLELKGRLVGLTLETEEEDVFHSSNFKRLACDDTITTRGMYQELQTSFKLMLKMILATNHLPKFTSFDDAVVRRLCIFLFPYVFCDTPNKDVEVEKQRDKDLGAIVGTQGFIYEFIEATLPYVHRVMIPSASMNAAVASYKAEQNPLSDWAAAFICSDPERLVKLCPSSSALRTSYLEYMKSLGVSMKEPVSPYKFTMYLRQLGYVSVKNRGVVVLKGYRLRSFDEVKAAMNEADQALRIEAGLDNPDDDSDAEY